MARCDELAAVSEEPGCLTRRYLTPPAKIVHQRLAGWMTDASLTPRVDNAGNLIGRLSGRGTRRVLLIGSHLDTVPNAGKYDGVLGVLMGLAVAERLRGEDLPFHLDVVGFSEEEGVRFSKPYLGCSALSGDFLPEWLDRRDAAGVSMRQAIADFGLDPDAVGSCIYDPADVLGFIEPHLEQGPVLEHAKLPVGMVSGIAGQSRLRVAFHGAAAHAGTTPMDRRQDALLCAAQFVTAVRARALSVEGLRATVGSVRVTPNAPNVVAAAAELSLDVRHAEDAQRESAVRDLIAAGHEAAASEGARFEVLEETSQSAVLMDHKLSSLLRESIEECGGPPTSILSGAGHDAVIMAGRFPVSMLFLRHPGAVSHHPDERVEAEDVAVGIDVLTRFVLRLARQLRSTA
ncbi:N-carbamoyl-L-amino acid hydrolase [Posidoniimonas polymericola]|uniref:N-carbamoyl-L-amino acid hydrolase n=2 Tax=Posidoniimonas polymericola TaxID=2528002 RepID=A0A5C5YMR2_9BACT|nr:N-carbamoyl-L-amino acid hydrolase [Posidoniimonas polymericola]